jgi:hypothetical protein
MTTATDTATVLELAHLATICLVSVFAASTIFGVVGMLKAPEPTVKMALALITSGSAIRLAIAVVIVLAVFGLRLLDQISPEATIAIISGISGYLLGGQTAGRSQSTEISN